jgi:UDP-glucose 4-epimerase
MELKDKKTLVTGGAGFIGSHLVDKLVEKGCEVVVVDNLAAGKMQFLGESRDKIQIENVDLGKPDSLESIIKGCDVVFHLAANPMVNIKEEETRLHLDSNILLTFNILESMRREGVSNIAFASTSTVYGEPSQVPTPENYGPLIPISLYAASKLSCEAMISAYCYNFNMRTVMYRFANVIGLRSTHGVIFDFINKLRADPNNMEILGREPGTKKSYIHISDTIDGIIHAYENSKEKVGIYNIGSEDSIDVRDIANIVCKEVGLQDVKYHWTGGVDDGRGWKGDIKTMLLDIEKIKQIGWKPKYGSSQAVGLTARELAKG